MNIWKKILFKVKKFFICNTYGYFNHKKYMYYYKSLLKDMGVNIQGEGPTFIGMKTYLDGTDYNLITIGEKTVISNNVTVLTHDFSNLLAIEIKNGNSEGYKHIMEPVKIGNKCFIGINATILPGTSIGDNTIVGAGAVVKGKIPSGVVVAGNPAKIISRVDEYAKKFIKG